MAKRMLIDATHAEETRVVVVNGTRLEQLDVESSTKKQLKGNIYLAKVIRVEPSLQAAFVDYGGNRHGFLAFSEIHPDYYQIPQADRQALIDAQAAEADYDDPDAADQDSNEETSENDGEQEDEAPRASRRSLRNYKIQEVIKRRQIMLVQVVKEERGNKGAALTTYLSLAGRYCVLMPNTARGGGVSRKITSVADRKRLKQIMAELFVPASMAVILRTAGQERSKAEISRDYEYLMRTWGLIRDTTLASRAPELIHEEGSLIKRAIRDVYSSDIEEVIVDGEGGYRSAKDFMKLLTPSHARRVQLYEDETMPLFHRYQVDSQLDAMHSPTVHLRSGGYIVINQTEALVAIDVNSGRATKERHIEETAVKTNLEAAEEIARQLRLRDLAGLVVIDFIDMEENRNNAAVERKLKEALKLDRARIQMGRISHFGLLELSRQRLRPSLMETSFEVCPHCKGSGMVRSVESAAVHILRVIEEEGVRRRSSEVVVSVSTPVALYILNNKRGALADIENRYDFLVYLRGDDSLISPDYRMERIKAELRDEREPVEEVAVVVQPVEIVDVQASEDESTDASGDSRKRRKRRKRRRRGEDSDDTSLSGEAEGTEGDLESDADAEGDTDTDTDADADGEATASDGEGSEGEDETEGEDGRDSKRRRRSRRGGRRRRRGEDDDAVADAGSLEQSNGGDQGPSDDAASGEGAVVPSDASNMSTDAPVDEVVTDREEPPTALDPNLQAGLGDSADAQDLEDETSEGMADAGSQQSSLRRRRRVRRAAPTTSGATSDRAPRKQAEAPTKAPVIEPVVVAEVAPVVEDRAPVQADVVPVAVEEQAPVNKPVEVVGAPEAATAPPKRGWWSRG
jgi:ribonuclease E